MTADQAEQLRILRQGSGERFDPGLSRDPAGRLIRRRQRRAGHKS
jgi:hypothetical protein